MNTAELSSVCKAVRRDIINMTANAGSGHPGGSLSAVELMVGAFYHPHAGGPPESPRCRTGTASSSARATRPPATTRVLAEQRLHQP